MHYNQGYGQGFPLPVDHPIQQNMVQQLPPLPQTQTAQQLPEQAAWDLHAALINQLQQNTTKGPIRIAMFNLYSDRQFCNNMYAELFETAGEYMFAALTANVPVTADQVADETLKVEVLNLLTRYRDLQQYLTQQQVADAQQFEQLKGQISNLVRSVQQQTQPQSHPGYGYSQPPGGYGMPVAGGRPGYNPHMGGGAPGYNPPMGGTMPGPGMNRPMGGGYQAPMGGGPRPGAMHGRPGAAGPTRPRASMIDNNTNPAGRVPPNASRKPTVGAGSVDTTNVLTRKEETAPMKHVPEVDREIGHLMAVQDHKEYAAPIDKNVQFISDRHTPAIRPNQRLVAEKAEDGSLSYSVITLEEHEMNYADHEEQPDMQKLARETQVSKKVGVPADWSRVTIPNVVEETDEAVDEELELDAPISLKSFVEGYGVDHARTEAQRKLFEKGVSTLSGRVVEYYLSVKTPILATNEEARLVDGLLQSKDLTHLVDNFTKLREELSSEVWFMVHDRMTCIFNRHLQGGVAFDGEIESIAEDYEDALVALAEELTPAAIDRFKLNVFVSMSKGIASKHSPKTKILDIVERTSVTQLPWSSTEMDLKLPAKYNMITVSVSSHMHAALIRLFKRTNVEDISVNRRYLVTADNVWLEIVHSDIAADTILISKVNRC